MRDRSPDVVDLLQRSTRCGSAVSTVHTPAPAPGAPRTSAAARPSRSGDKSAGLLSRGRARRSRPASAVDTLRKRGIDRSHARTGARRAPTSAAARPSRSGDKSAGLPAGAPDVVDLLQRSTRCGSAVSTVHTPAPSPGAPATASEKEQTVPHQRRIHSRVA